MVLSLIKKRKKREKREKKEKRENRERKNMLYNPIACLMCFGNFISLAKKYIKNNIQQMHQMQFLKFSSIDTFATDNLDQTLLPILTPLKILTIVSLSTMLTMPCDLKILQDLKKILDLKKSGCPKVFQKSCF